MKNFLTFLLTLPCSFLLSINLALASDLLKDLPPASVRNTGTTNVFIITDLGISKPTYMVTGEVRYSNINSPGYLESINHFENNAQFFTRTMAESGPMGQLRGTSGWRPFALPFFTAANGTDSGMRPIGIDVNVVLPGGGEVEMQNVKLYQFALDEDPFSVIPGTQNSWWAEKQGGMLGALLGVLIGCCGALLGFLISKAKGRSFVVGTMYTLVALGTLSLILGLYAYVNQQPYAVYYTLLLCGALLTAIIGVNIKPVKRRYAEVELRKMEAKDRF